MEARILYQDEYIAAAFKSCGVLSEAHDSLPNMPAILRELCGCEVNVVHRLDRTTQGIMIFAKTRAAAAKLSAQIQRGEVQKTYLAVVEGTPDEHGELTDLLYYDRTRGKSYVVRRERRGVKEAKLTYERLHTAQIGSVPVSEVRVDLLTGRTHQIRVQFASRKMPLVGDHRYGSHVPAEQIALCASRLRFAHPITGEPMQFEIDPAGDAFLLFQNHI